MNFLSSLASPLQHCERTMFYLIKRLNIHVTTSTIQKDLPQHPDYPSLLSISDVLKHYGINNIAFKTGPGSFKRLDPPFIAHVSGKKARHDLFAVVSAVKPDGVTMDNPETGKQERLSYEEFDKIYKGTVLAVEAGEQAGRKIFSKSGNRRK